MSFQALQASGPVLHSKFVGQQAGSNQAPAPTADAPLARSTTPGQDLKGHESCRHVDQEGGRITWIERPNWGGDRRCAFFPDLMAVYPRDDLHAGSLSGDEAHTVGDVVELDAHRYSSRQPHPGEDRVHVGQT